MSWRPILLGGAALLAVSVGLVVALGGSPESTGADPAAPAGTGRPPNIVVVMTDDQALSTVAEGTPRSLRSVGRAGTEFEHSIVTTPLCCPSRAAFVSGQYGHNNGVVRNDPGYETLRDARNVLPSWLAASGYRTAMVGKFMNGYDRTKRGRDRDPAPGWEEWVELRRPFGYYGYALNVDGRKVDFGEERRDYLTDELTRRALRTVGRLRTDRRPLFLWLSQWAPHPEPDGRTPGSCDGDAIPPDRAPLPLPGIAHPAEASFEPDVSDKPLQVSVRDPLSEAEIRRTRRSFRCAVGALREVDRGTRLVRDRLAELGELERTIFVFTSDNGYMFGEHRLPAGKGVPYEEAVRVPLAIDLPPRFGPQPASIDVPVANIDLAPTLLELAGAEPCLRSGRCRRLDGRSLLPLLRGDRPAELTERPLLVETGKGHPCAFRSVRHEGKVFVEYPPRKLPLCRELERELYDLEADPEQLQNRLGTATGPLTEEGERLQELLERLAECGGEPGREACP